MLNLSPSIFSPCLMRRLRADTRTFLDSRPSFMYLEVKCAMQPSSIQIIREVGMGKVRTCLVTVAISGLLVGSLAGHSFASEGGHVKETIKHAKEGIAHVKEAIQHLEEAVKNSVESHAKEALEHAKESLKHAEESLAHAEQAHQHKPKGKAK